jgi:hypothetical protein
MQRGMGVRLGRTVDDVGPDVVGRGWKRARHFLDFGTDASSAGGATSAREVRAL